MRCSRSVPFARPVMGLGLVAVLAVAGCRSDGGFGRSDAPESRAWAAGRVRAHTRRDMKTTSDTLSGIPETLSRNWDTSVRNLNRSRDLYVGKRSFPVKRKAEREAAKEAGAADAAESESPRPTSE